MGLPAPILSGTSILYLTLAAHKYSNKVHLSMFLLGEKNALDEMVRILPTFTQPTRPHKIHTHTFAITYLSSIALLPQLWLSAVL